MGGQQRQKISELQFGKFPNPQFFFWCGKLDYKTQVTTCSDCPSEALLWIKEVEMVDSFYDKKNLTMSLWKGFSKLRDAGREDRFCSDQDHPEFPVQEEG